MQMIWLSLRSSLGVGLCFWIGLAMISSYRCRKLEV